MHHRSSRAARIAKSLLTASLFATGPAAGEIPVDRHPAEVFTFMTLGQLVDGRVEADATVKSQFFTRTGVGLRQSVTVAERLEMAIALGGLFYHPLPELVTLTDSRNVRFGPGLGEVSGSWTFGDLESPRARLKWGLFNHKYNPDAKNFGEYLYRSGTYMPYLWSGGSGSWNILNSNAYWAQGLKFDLNLLDGKWTNEFTLFMARDIQEIQFDLSPGWISTYHVGNWLTVGAGVNFAHALPIRPSKVSPKERQNAYVRADAPATLTYLAERWVDTNGDGTPDTKMEVPVSAAGNILPKSEWSKRGLSLGDPLLLSAQEKSQLEALEAARAADADPSNDIKYLEEGFRAGQAVDPEVLNIVNGGKSFAVGPGGAFVSESDNGISKDYLGYYSYQGIKAMGRVAVYPNEILQIASLHPKDLGVYAEAGLLGVQDYPYFYEKRSERIPIMVGVNIPTFKALDVLAVEYEYYPYPYPRNIDYMVESAFPRPQFSDPQMQEDPALARAPAWKTGEDGRPALRGMGMDPDEKTKWTIYGRKTLFNSLSLTLQAARDHYRAISITNAPHDQSWTRRAGEWYYAFQLEQTW